jgi:hypothetical protein
MSYYGGFKESFLGAASTNRGRVNTLAMAVAFVLSIMVINNYRQCKPGEGYPENNTITYYSYILAIIILIAACLLFAYDLAIMAKILK